jgi:hypothetical protein
MTSYSKRVKLSHDKQRTLDSESNAGKPTCANSRRKKIGLSIVSSTNNMHLNIS